MGKVDKVYLNNTNLAYALSDTAPDIGNVKETVFFSTMRPTQPITAFSISDFRIGKSTFGHSCLLIRDTSTNVLEY